MLITYTYLADILYKNQQHATLYRPPNLIPNAPIPINANLAPEVFSALKPTINTLDYLFGPYINFDTTQRYIVDQIWYPTLPHRIRYAAQQLQRYSPLEFEPARVHIVYCPVCRRGV